ncbi:MAG: hypothetical protein ACXVZO_11995 [Gaiellaceae bacterium]
MGDESHLDDMRRLIAGERERATRSRERLERQLRLEPLSESELPAGARPPETRRRWPFGRRSR